MAIYIHSFLLVNLLLFKITGCSIANAYTIKANTDKLQNYQKFFEETVSQTLNDFCTIDTAHIQWCCSVRTSLMPVRNAGQVLTFSSHLDIKWPSFARDKGDMRLPADSSRSGVAGVGEVRVSINRQDSALCRHAHLTSLLHSPSHRRRRRSTLTPVELLLPADITNQLLTDDNRRQAMRSELQQDILVIFLQSLNISDIVIEAYGNAASNSGSTTQSSGSSSSSLPLWAILDIVIGCLLLIIMILLIILCCCCCHKRCTGSENQERSQAQLQSRAIGTDSALSSTKLQTQDKAINTSAVNISKISDSKSPAPRKSVGGETSRLSQERLSKGPASKESSAAGRVYTTDRRRGIKVVPLPPSTHDSATDMTFDPPCRSFVDMVAADLDDDEVALDDRPSSRQMHTHNFYNELNYV